MSYTDYWERLCLPGNIYKIIIKIIKGKEYDQQTRNYPDNRYFGQSVAS